MSLLGTTIMFNKVLERIDHKWEEFSLEQTKEGIIIGIRTLSNGYIEKEYEDNHPFGRLINKVYIPKEHFKAYLVSYNIYRKPVFVRI